ncbi:polysaccharide pyruvyl transferase family protein [Pelagerythrobacter sp.]|uniref:polysaccharide pyruvyl transferase family protein n=1 Tax=Pelagerythrobacter sp. TaxID=2800702 RepID=UPI0035B30716
MSETIQTVHPRVVLITKTATQNQGNQALSIAWRDFLARRYPDANVRLVERAPGYLKRYTVGELKRARDPVAAFDALARKLVARMPAAPARDPSRWAVRHDHEQQQVLRFVRLRKALRLRSRVAALGLGEKDYLDRLAFICTADLVVVNPAGEFQADATDTALHYLLETRCAQLAGARTAFVNLSFELEDKMLVALSDHVFAQCDLVEFRDTESVDYLAENGGRTRPIVLPDGAAMSAIERTGGTGGGGLALAINALQVRTHGLTGQWDGIIDRLRTRHGITLTSNEWSTDFPFWQKYLELDGIECEGRTLPYDEYARHLAGFDAVVSSRLHTCVLGLIAGAPIIPVETGTFKLTGFFNAIGMDGEPIRMGDGDWEARIEARIEDVLADRDATLKRQDECLFDARSRLVDGLTAAFPEIGGRGGAADRENYR